MQRNEIKNTVYKILEKDTRAREDDNYLIYKTVEKLFPNISIIFFNVALQKLAENKISFESITRARRKFLEERPDLKPKNKTTIRKEEAILYKKEYGRHVPRID